MPVVVAVVPTVEPLAVLVLMVAVMVISTPVPVMVIRLLLTPALAVVAVDMVAMPQPML